MKEMEALSDLAPEDIPEASRFLLKINFTELSKCHIETQKYWTLAVNAALVAQNRERARGVRAKWVRGWINTKIPSRQKLGLVAIEQQIRKDGMHWPPTQSNITDQHTQASIESYVRKRPHPSAALSQPKLNKRMRKPDWLSQLCALCVRGYTLSLFLAIRLDYLPDELIPKGPGTHRGTQPSCPGCGLAVVRCGNQKDFVYHNCT